MKLLNKKKLFKFSFVMGRFSKKIGDKFQYFPIDNWQYEIEVAKKFNFDGVEWILSDYSNPLFNDLYLEEIIKKLKKNKISIISLYLDLIMIEPLHKISSKNFLWIIKKLKFIQSKLRIARITIPIEETCRFYFNSEKKIVINKLNYFIKRLGNKSKISIETDITPNNLKNFLKLKKLKKLGLLIDIGNLRANGYDIKEYTKYFANKIHGFHIKFRNKNFGKTQILPEKFYELNFLGKNIEQYTCLNDLTFQTFRSEKNFISDMKKSIKNFNKIFYEKK